MTSNFMIYGAYGFVGERIARLALERGHRPLLAGRNAEKLHRLSDELGLERRAFELNDREALERALENVSAVLHCAGPYRGTYKPVVEACLRTRSHYIDLTGEIPVFQGVHAYDAQAKETGVMLMPAAGFDVVPTDCLAVYLKERLPTATHLVIGMHSRGPAGLPPGTQRTLIEMLPFGIRLRRDGELVRVQNGIATRQIDFGNGLRKAVQLSWGDIYTAYYSTGIGNIENYIALPGSLRRLLRWGQRLVPLFKLRALRGLLKAFVQPGPTAEKRARTSMHIWAEARDDRGRQVAARMHGPEAGVEWTRRAALAVAERALERDAPPGYQTPGMAYGADFALECEGVQREDV